MQDLKHVPNHGHDFTAEEIRDLVGTSPFIIEVGCNNGRDTQRFLEVMPFCHVVCFDPEPRAAKHFLCKDHPRVTFKQIPIADMVCERHWYKSGGIRDCNDKEEEWYQSGSICEPTGHLKRSPEIKFTKMPKIRCWPLDFFWDEYQPTIDFLWCDAQGADALVILGGQRTLMQTRYATFEWYPEPLYEGAADLRGLCTLLPHFDLIGIYGENALFKNKQL